MSRLVSCVPTRHVVDWHVALVPGGAGAGNDLPDMLFLRQVPVSLARKRILAQKDLKQLERWLEKAIVATSIDDLFKNRS